MSDIVWAVEVFESSHWQTVEGGLTKEVALAGAKELAASGKRASVAAYTDDEGASAVGREEVS